MRRKNVKSRIMTIGLGAAILLVIALIVVIVLGKKRLDEAKQQAEELQLEISSNKQLVYVASRDLEKGEIIDETNVMQQMIYTGLGPDSYMTGDAMGDTLIVDVKANEPIMAGMVKPIEITQDMRKYEMMTAHLMTTQTENDVVDVRILFPNGEDFLLLAKKQVMDLQMDASIFTTYLNEEEILRMASAIVDAYTTTGARIYTVKYLEENIQEEATPNYPVKAATLDLINSDPNILTKAEHTLNLQARNDLDRRMSGISKEMLEAVANGLALEDTASQSVIREGLQQAAAAEGDALDTAMEAPVEEGSADEETSAEETEEVSSDDEEGTALSPSFDYGQDLSTSDGMTIQIAQ